MSGFTYTVVDDPDGGDTQVVGGFNAAGTVVGAYDGAGYVLTGFVGNGDSFTTVMDPQATTGAFDGTYAEAIDNAGTIVGYYTTGAEDNVGFVDVGGNFSDITDPLAATGAFTGTEVYGINGVGDLWGLYTAADYSAANFVDIGGTYSTISPVLAADNMAILGISEDGAVAGNYQTESGSYQSFVWSQGTYTTLTNPSAGTGWGAGTFAESINATGTIAGYYVTDAGNAVGFTYVDGVFTDVNAPAAGNGSGAGTFITSINDAGEMAGFFVTDADAETYLAEGFVDDAGSISSVNDPFYAGISDAAFNPAITLNDAGAVLENYDDANGDDVTILADPACYFPGTMIRTPDGEAAVESLAIGDRVVTADGRVMAVRWIGRAAVSTRFADPLRTLPIRVRAGALAEGLPARDLLVSPEHALFVRDILIQAGALVNGVSIIRERAVPERFTYYHIELAEHALVLAEGTPAETFVDYIGRRAFDNWAEHEALYGDEPWIAELSYPRAQSVRQVPADIKAALLARGIRNRAA
jgi:hypothetical protein